MIVFFPRIAFIVFTNRKSNFLPGKAVDITQAQNLPHKTIIHGSNKSVQPVIFDNGKLELSLNNRPAICYLRGDGSLVRNLIDMGKTRDLR